MKTFLNILIAALTLAFICVSAQAQAPVLSTAMQQYLTKSGLKPAVENGTAYAVYEWPRSLVYVVHANKPFLFKAPNLYLVVKVVPVSANEDLSKDKGIGGGTDAVHLATKEIGALIDGKGYRVSEPFRTSNEVWFPTMRLPEIVFVNDESKIAGGFSRIGSELLPILSVKNGVPTATAAGQSVFYNIDLADVCPKYCLTGNGRHDFSTTFSALLNDPDLHAQYLGADVTVTRQQEEAPVAQALLQKEGWHIDCQPQADGSLITRCNDNLTTDCIASFVRPNGTLFTCKNQVKGAQRQKFPKGYRLQSMAFTRPDGSSQIYTP